MLGKKPGNKTCPMLKKPCIQQDCMWFVQIRGAHPQTGDPVDEWDCAVIWQPLLLIENSSQQRATGAAVESFRNEMVKANEQSQRILLNAAEQHLIGRSES
jgi:hypothetical protein